MCERFFISIHGHAQQKFFYPDTQDESILMTWMERGVFLSMRNPEETFSRDPLNADPLSILNKLLKDFWEGYGSPIESV